MAKIFKTAPLPFQGQKKNFVKQFENVLGDFINQNGITTVVDLFGGSGLLSHTAKRLFPYLKVVYNDFDDYHVRLGNVDRTNEILAQIRTVLDDYPRRKIITKDRKQKIFDIIYEYEKKGFVDYITLSASLLFSAKYVTSFEQLLKQSLYNNSKRSDYNCDGYLNGLKIVKSDYKELFEHYKSDPSAMFVVDPPYLSTDTSSYNSDKYWKLKDYLDVLLVLTEGNYIYFTSNKSQIVELCDWFAEHYGINTPFSDAVVMSHRVKGKVMNYTDLMYVKCK